MIKFYVFHLASEKYNLKDWYKTGIKDVYGLKSKFLDNPLYIGSQTAGWHIRDTGLELLCELKALKIEQ